MKPNQDTKYSAEDFITHDMNHFAHSAHLINSIVVPRPIALISSKGPNEVINVAPFSYFNIVCSHPVIVSIAIQHRDGKRKDTAHNIIAHKEFVINICSLYLAKQVSITGGDFPPDVSELDLAHFSILPSEKISVPRIANTLVQMECQLEQVVEVKQGAVELILGRVIKIHAHKTILKEDGSIDIQKLDPLSRLAGLSYAKTEYYCDLPRGL